MLSGDDSLKKRPMKPILDALESMGAKCSSVKGKPPISVEGEVKVVKYKYLVLSPANLFQHWWLLHQD